MRRLPCFEHSVSNDAGTIEAAKAVEKHHPASKILFYRNVICDYESYSFDTELNSTPGWSLSHGNGEDKLVRNSGYRYVRELEHASVWLDAEAMRGVVTWR